MFEDLNYEELKRRANSRLPDRVVATLEAHGERRSVAGGETLYRVEDRQYPLVYAISATLQIRDPDGMVLGVMEPGQFTGELALLFGQTAFADCIAITPGEVLLVAPQTIAELVQVDPEVSDVLLPAFAARRLLLMQRQQGTLTLVGHGGAPALQRLLEYAERNRIPYRWERRTRQWSQSGGARPRSHSTCCTPSNIPSTASAPLPPQGVSICQLPLFSSLAH